MKDLINTASRMLKHRALGLLFIRAAIGMVFIMHGWSKVQNIPGVEGMMMSFGFPAGTGIFVAGLEVIGGAALILGVLPRVFAALFVILMTVAFFVTGGFATGYRAHELELVLILGSLGILFAGSGRWSLWARDCHHCGGMMCNGKECPCKDCDHK